MWYLSKAGGWEDSCGTWSKAGRWEDSCGTWSKGGRWEVGIEPGGGKIE